MLKWFRRRRGGQGTVEFALCLPLLITTILGILEISWVMYQTITVNHVCRAATRLGSMADPDGTPKTNAEITAFVQQAMRGIWKPTNTVTIEVFDVEGGSQDSEQRGMGFYIKVTILHRLQFFTPLMDTFNRVENQTTIQASSQFQCE